MENVPIPVQYKEIPVAATATAVYSSNDDESEGIGLIEYWRIIRRRKGTVIVLAFAGLVLGLLITLPQTPVYRAKAVLEVQDINQDFMNMRQSSLQTQNYNAFFDIQTQIKIIQSESIRDRTIAKLRSAKGYDVKAPASARSLWRSLFNLPQPAPVDLREKLLQDMAYSMTVRAAGQTRIIEVLVDSPHPELAAAFANTVVNEFIDQNMEARWKMSERTGEWLGRQLDEMRIRLEKSEDSLQAYARQAGLLFVGGGGSADKDERRANISEDRLRQLQNALSNASADRVAKQSRFEMAKNSSPDALPDVLNDSTLRDYQRNLTDLRRLLAEATSTYTAEFPKVKRLQAQVQTLETALERERKAIITRISNEYDEAVRREKLLGDDFANQAKTVTGEGEKSIQYNILKREVESNRHLYDAMLQRLKESSLAAALKASNIRPVDNAKPPRRPFSPNPKLNAAFGLLGGVVFGIGFVILRDRADRSLQGPGDAMYWLNVPELGTIPSAKADSRKLGYYGPKTRELPAQLSETGAKSRIELVTLQQKPSRIAEAFRTVLTSILFTGENGTRPRVLVLTSPNPSEGKTTVISNLAIAMSEIRQKVLLIDADLRKPRIHDIFQVNNDRGLTDILRDGFASPEALRGIIQESEMPGLFVLPSGPATSAAANLLFAGRMPELLAKLRGDFDMILIDTPPMLEMPDARVVGRMADGVILVTRSGRTTRDAALAARHRFAEDQIRLLGIVMNDWDPKTSSKGYYGTYKGGRYYKSTYATYSSEQH